MTETETAPAVPPPPSGALGRLRSLVRSSELALTATAALVGVAAAVLVLFMSRAVQWAHVWLFGIDLNGRLSGAERLAPVSVLLWPTVGGLIVGLSVWLSTRSGRPPAADPIEANALRGGRMSVWDSVVVTLQTLVSNGFGASVGLEAGYTQAGAGFASALGGRLRLRRADLRVLVGCGAAGAIAAAFGAPLTGAFYGFEVVIGAYTTANVAPVMAAAIAGSLTAQTIGGSLYHIDAASAVTVRGLDYAVFIPLGVLCAGLAILLMRSVSTVQTLFRHRLLPAPLRPALGGLCVGLLALITPQALSAGHGALLFDLTAAQGVRVVLMLMAIKMAASALSLGSGFRGGLFFASLLVGALAGQAYAQILTLTGHVAIDQTAAALVGMGAFAVAIVGGPLTMSFLVLETTGDYALTGAVLAASVVSSLIVRETFGYSFSTFRLHLRGESIRSAHDVGWMRSLTVGRLMRRDPPTVPAPTTLKEFRRRFPLGSQQWVVLLDESERYAGMLSPARAHEQGRDETLAVAELVVLRDTVLTPALNVKQALTIFDRVEADTLAVTDGPDGGKVLGVLNETFAVRRYAQELDRSRQDLIGEPARGDDQA